MCQMLILGVRSISAAKQRPKPRWRFTLSEGSMLEDDKVIEVKMENAE